MLMPRFFGTGAVGFYGALVLLVPQPHSDSCWGDAVKLLGEEFFCHEQVWFTAFYGNN
jgi:hypothetical protein